MTWFRVCFVWCFGCGCSFCAWIAGLSFFDLVVVVAVFCFYTGLGFVGGVIWWVGCRVWEGGLGVVVWCGSGVGLG